MQANSPHYLLFSEASGRAAHRHHWRFVLRSVAGDQCLAAADVEPGIGGGRLELLAVVRGLEALDQPSRVSLLTRSRYVRRGIRRGLNQWRDRQWRWERFGRLVPIRDHDLWRRVDRALRIHQVQCYPWQWNRSPTPAIDVSASVVLPMTGAAPTADERLDEAALLIVPRAARPDPPRRRLRRTAFGRALVRLGQAVAASLAAMFPPPFTRAA